MKQRPGGLTGTSEIEMGMAITHISSNGGADPQTRDRARLALHKMAVDESAENELEDLIFMLGLNVTDRDVAAGISYAPCEVDGVTHLNHKPYPPPGKFQRVYKRSKSKT